LGPHDVNRSLTDAYAAASPETNTDSAARSAIVALPDTGARRQAMRRALAFAAASREASSETVLVSIHTVPGCA
jgi:hypothetical protein